MTKPQNIILILRKKYIDRGLTGKDVDKTILELKKDCETCTKRIKELRKNVKESSLLENSFIDDIIVELDL